MTILSNNLKVIRQNLNCTQISLAEVLEIGFNARYLLDIANQVEGENMVFDLSDGASPTIIRDPADQNALYVLMPMRV